MCFEQKFGSKRKEKNVLARFRDTFNSVRSLPLKGRGFHLGLPLTFPKIAVVSAIPMLVYCTLGSLLVPLRPLLRPPTEFQWWFHHSKSVGFPYAFAQQLYSDG